MKVAFNPLIPLEIAIYCLVIIVLWRDYRRFRSMLSLAGLAVAGLWVLLFLSTLVNVLTGRPF